MGEPLLLDAIDTNNETRFLMLMAFRKHIDLNACDVRGFSALFVALEAFAVRDYEHTYLHTLLQAGIKLDNRSVRAFLFGMGEKRISGGKILLFCGCDPRN